MTTANTPKLPATEFQLPEPEQTQDEKMTAFRHLSLTGGAHYLAQHLGKPETTVVGSDLYLAPVPPDQLQSMSGVLYPDLFVAFDADPAGYLARNGYVISEQGKPPDFVLEIASRSTGRRDTVDKRISYAALGIQEYWRFDETGQFHGTRLAGDHLVSGQYEPLPIEELTDGSLQGYSAILSLNLRWTEGQLGWYDPNAGRHIATLESERQALAEERQALAEERQARIQAEAKLQELQNQLRQLRGE